MKRFTVVALAGLFLLAANATAQTERPGPEDEIAQIHDVTGSSLKSSSANKSSSRLEKGAPDPATVATQSEVLQVTVAELKEEIARLALKMQEVRNETAQALVNEQQKYNKLRELYRSVDAGRATLHEALTKKDAELNKVLEDLARAEYETGKARKDAAKGQVNQKKYARVENVLEERTEKVVTLEADLEKSESLLKEEKKITASLNSQLAASARSLAEKKENLTALGVRLTVQDKELKELQANVAQKEELVKELQRQVTHLSRIEAEKQKQAELIVQRESTIAALQKTAKAKDAQLSVLQDRVQDLTEQLEELGKSLGVTKTSCAKKEQGLAIQLAAKKEELAIVSVDRERADGALAQGTRDINALKKQVADLAESLTIAKADRTSVLRKSKDVAAGKNARIAALTDSSRKSLHALAEAQGEITELQTAMAKLEKKLVAATRKAGGGRAALEQLAAKKDIEIAFIEKEFSKKNQELTAARLEMSVRKKQVADLTESLAIAKADQTSALRKSKDVAAGKNASIVALTDSSRKNLDALAEAQGEIAELQTAIAKLEKKLVAATRKAGGGRAALEQLAAKKDIEIAFIEKEFSKKNQELIAARSEVNAFKVQIEELGKGLAKARTEVGKEKEKGEKLVIEREAHLSSLKAAHQEKEIELLQARSEIKKLSNRLGAGDGKITDLMTERNEKEVELAKKEKAVDELLKNIVNASEGVARARKEMSREHVQSRTLLEEASTTIVELIKERDSNEAALEVRNKEIDGLVVELKKIREQSKNERVDAHYNLAAVYRARQMYEDAEKEYIKALTIDPADADIHYNLGILYDDDLDNKAKAKKHYERFLELSPHDEDSEKVKIWLMEL